MKIEEDEFFKQSEELANAIMPYIPWIKEQVEKNESNRLEISYIDIRKKLGSKFENVQSPRLYDLIKFVLYHEGMVVEERHDMLVMRNATVDDKLPPHLDKYFDIEEEKV